MTLDQLRKAIDGMADLPGHLPVQCITHTGAVKPVDDIRWSPLAGGLAGGGIAVFERHKTRY